MSTTVFDKTGFTNSMIDTVAVRISMGQTVEEIREMLLECGLTEYNAYLCYKAALFLFNDKEFYPRQGKD